MPIFKILLEEHRQIIKSMDDIVAFLTEPSYIPKNALYKLYNTFYEQLLHHHMSEENIVYPVFNKSKYLQSRIIKSYQFHTMLHDGTSQLKSLLQEHANINIALWEAKFMIFRDVWLLHLQEEEHEIFPVANEILSSIEKYALVKQYKNLSLSILPLT